MKVWVFDLEANRGRERVEFLVSGDQNHRTHAAGNALHVQLNTNGQLHGVKGAQPVSFRQKHGGGKQGFALLQ